MPKRIEWTHAQDKCLINLNREPLMTLEGMADALGVSIRAVRTRLKALADEGRIPPKEAVRKRGVKKGKSSQRRKWTPEKLQQLIALFDGKRSDEQIAQPMGETRTAIRGQVWLLRKAGRLPKGRRNYKLQGRLLTSRLFSAEQDRVLVKHWEAGHTASTIGQALGFTRNQIRNRVRRLQLAGRLHRRDRAWYTRRKHRRQQRIAKMFHDGVLIAQIAHALHSTPGSIGVELVRLRKLGQIGLRKRPYGRATP